MKHPPASLRGAHSVAARLERLPMSGYHRLILSIIALAFFFDSVDLGLMTFVLGSIKTEFQLSSAQAGFIGSASFLGMVGGAVLSGLLADRFGRTPVLQSSMVLWGVASYLCSTAATPEQLFGYRLLLGVGMGMEFPVAQTLLAELIPARQRGRYIALMDGFWPLGFITAGLLSYWILQEHGWRTVFLISAVPALFLLVVRQWVPESPRWLESAGQHARAESVIAQIERKVIASLGLISLPAPQALQSTGAAAGKGSFAALWTPRQRSRTVMVWLLWFLALLGFYSLTTWLSALMQQSGYQVTKSVLYTVWISLGGIPGFLTAAWLVERWGRKPTCIAALLGGATMIYVYGQMAQGSGNETALIASGLVMQFFLFGMWAVLYTYTPELYGTHARATGSGCASAVGRVGALLGPTLVGLILPLWGQGGVFLLGTACFALAAAAVYLLGVETRGMTLEGVSEAR
nr:MFS transporter [uncultured Pseudogulbenkiania sp.]